MKITIPIYLINLENSAQRLAEFTEQMQRLNLPFVRVSAVDAKTLSQQQLQLYKAEKPPVIKHQLSAAEIACFLSHIEVWKKIARNDAPCALVCEDDARFDTDLKKLLASLSGKEPDWDMLRLYSHKQEPPVELDCLIDGYQALTVEKITMSTVAYIITKPAAMHLLETVLPIYLPIDGYLKRWWHHGLCSKQVWPSIVSPASSKRLGSTIENGRISSRSDNKIVRFINNMRYQLHLKRQRRRNIGSLPRARRFY